ncbi:cytoplasmic protein [Fictibacillus aquaticus]|uniref:Cytoplasmic protein n=1 Tax=Fictibacillus aquaticus TaxID=2021314 RepID=A0A235F4C1_9BACL|nr:cytoplasmic protein [Fictibacillus aquaticus]OYD56078.1 cytoplasmic protein [Fictibacillus aquaticus]
MINHFEEAHRFSRFNRKSLESDSTCGCFYCIEIYHPEKIDDWADEDENTAICPYCGIDSVIGESSGYPITKEFLKSMHEVWF